MVTAGMTSGNYATKPRRLKAAIDCEPLRALVADGYAVEVGAPAPDPVRVLKLSLRQFQYDLSDSQVRRQAQVNVAFRFFLDVSVESPLPVPSLLAQLRTRLGEERCTRVVNEILRPARTRERSAAIARCHTSDRQCGDSLYIAVSGANVRAVAAGGGAFRRHGSRSASGAGRSCTSSNRRFV